MNRFRLVVVGMTLMFAQISAQQTNAGTTSSDKQEQGQPAGQSTAPEVDRHLKALSEKLGLSVDQQAKIKPILRQMLDARQKLMQDDSLSDEARGEKEKTLHDQADRQARKVLNDEQKRKLDELEQEKHPEMHGNPNETASPQQ
jgi:hypothetical protein